MRSRRSSVVRLSSKVKSTRTRATSCGGGGPRSRTSGTSSGSNTSRRPTSCAVGSPAKTSAARARGRGLPVDEAGSGSRLPAPLARFDPSSSSWKTLGASARGGSTGSSPTLPKQGSMRSGRLYARPMSGPRTDARGCSFWPTPTAVAYGTSQNGSNASRPSAGTPGLEWLGRWWPTPCAADARDSARHTTRPDAASHAGTTLTDKIRQWCSRHVQTTGKHGRGGRGTAVLNPAFVEMLMGLPQGYTRVDDVAAYDALVARSCHSRRQRLF